MIQVITPRRMITFLSGFRVLVTNLLTMYFSSGMPAIRPITPPRTANAIYLTTKSDL